MTKLDYQMISIHNIWASTRKKIKTMKIEKIKMIAKEEKRMTKIWGKKTNRK